MALRHRSTIKRARQNEKTRLRNRKVKLEMKSAIKQAKKSKTQEDLKKAYSVIDRARKRGVIHPNTAARKKSRLAKFVKEQAKVKREAKEVKKEAKKKPQSAKKKK